jgi:hypothetical protein
MLSLTLSGLWDCATRRCAISGVMKRFRDALQAVCHRVRKVSPSNSDKLATWGEIEAVRDKHNDSLSGHAHGSFDYGL